MADRRDALDSVRLDEGAARRLLERATELDAKLANESTVADLRDAARGAGISEEAFQRALAEVRAERSAEPDEAFFDFQRRQPWRRVFVALAIGFLIAAAFLAFRRSVFISDGARAVPAAPAVPATPPPPPSPPPPPPGAGD